VQTNDIRIDRWEQLIEKFEELDPGWVFRGQRDAGHDLRTSLERHTPRDLKPSSAESRLLYEFKRRAHLYLGPHQIPAPDDAGEWLALMQHFGAPTRLLDMTRSPYVAAYFAAEDMDESGECAVWAVQQIWCLEAAGAAILKALPPEEQTSAENVARKEHISPALVQGVYSASLLRGDSWRANSTSVVVPFVPERLSERLSIQQGEFLVPLDVDRPFMENLSALEGADQHITKYIIGGSARGRILERLRIMNITRAQLFPGLDGFAQSFRQLLIEEPVEAKLERLRRKAVMDALKGLDRAAPTPPERAAT
jgi:hypothetical protein